MARYGAAEEVTEEQLVRDLLFVFQGIQGTHVTYSLLEGAFIIQPSLVLSPSHRKLVHELAEMGWLFKKVQEWLNICKN